MEARGIDTAIYIKFAEKMISKGDKGDEYAITVWDLGMSSVNSVTLLVYLLRQCRGTSEKAGC